MGPDYAYVVYTDDNEMSQTLKLFKSKESLKHWYTKVMKAYGFPEWETMEPKLDTQWEVEFDDYEKCQRLELK